MAYKYEEGIGWVYYDAAGDMTLPVPQINVGAQPQNITDQIRQGPASSVFSPQEYSLLKSEENLAPNFRVDRGLGQGSSNINYSKPPAQNAPNFAPVETNDSAITYTGATPRPNFAPVETNDSAITYTGVTPQPDFTGIGTGSQVPGERAITGPGEQIGPQFGSGETRGTGTIGGDSAITEGDLIGPDFSNPGGTGKGPQDDTWGGGGYVPTSGIQTSPVNSRPLSEDWRFKIGLLPSSTVLYKDGDPSSILSPLLATDGVIFPYTPNVLVNYRSNYEKTAPTHSNYPSYFYQSSEISDVQVNATFTAQSVAEADYLLAVIHFFKSATKMFYGQDQNRGLPPPLVAVSGFGQHQFNFHKAVVSQFNYSLPDDVDYIRTSDGGVGSIQAQSTRAQLSGGTGNFGIFGIASRIGRLFGIGATEGAESTGFTAANEGTNLAKKGATYVPTKIEISLILLPVVTRAEQSKNFSLKEYAQGRGLSQRGQW